MKECCFDTSGFSNPLETMPEDIHVAIWSQVREVIASGIVAVTPEIYAELERLRGELGDCIRNNKSQMVLEVGEGSWDWHSFTTNSAAMINSYRAFISEYNGDIKGTVGMNDVSIVALAKTLRVPLVSMEIRVMAPGNTSQRKRRIPDLCDSEGVEHLTFTEFLRSRNIRG